MAMLCRTSLACSTFQSLQNVGFVSISQYCVHPFLCSLHGQDLTDVALFRVGFESLLAVAGMRAQFLYVWRGGGFYLRQVFSVPRGFQWHPISLGSCRDDVLLALATTDATYPIKLFAWSSRMRQFREIDRGLLSNSGSICRKLWAGLKAHWLKP